MKENVTTATNAEKDYILQVKSLRQYFPIGKDIFGRPNKFVKAVDGVSFNLERGKTIGIVGESGCGKTTLGRSILRLYDITSGSALYTSDTEDVVYEQKVYKKVPVYQTEDDGLTPLLVPKTDKNGNAVVDKKGNPVMVKKQLCDEQGKPVYRKLYCDNRHKPVYECETVEGMTKPQIKLGEDGKPIVKRAKKQYELAELQHSDLTALRTELQLIFQDPYSSLPPRMTVGEIISEAVKVHGIVPKEETYNYVINVMKRCGLQSHYYDRYPHEFSGGQRQRICIARALAVKPKLVICDEPVSALDVSIQAQVINLLKKLQREEGMSYIFISHDLSVVKYISDTIAVMYLGNIVEYGSTDDICNHPKHPYTQALFSAVPVANPHSKSDPQVLEGELPSPANPPKGCKFHTRCKYCTDACKMQAQVMAEVSEGHFVACNRYSDEKQEQ
ncbi:MAG: ATP-binding cassette domain-containing protein [Corallococcus sp.]|nr:ATP-binding cassette domain-containing protein [Corallococcus sp.]